jgi:hypothetical protein
MKVVPTAGCSSPWRHIGGERPSRRGGQIVEVSVGR